MLLAAQYDFTAYDRGFFEATLTLTDANGGNAIDLTNFSAQFDIGALFGKTPLLSVGETPTTNNSVISYPSRTAGQIKVYISQVDIALLGAGTLPQYLVHNLLLTDSATTQPAPYVVGGFTVYPGLSA